MSAKEWGTLCYWAASAFLFGAFVATLYESL